MRNLVPTLPRKSLGTLAVIAVLAVLPAHAQDCAKADAAIDRVTTWPALAQAVKDYRACDQGTSAELFTEALLRVLIGGWPKVSEAAPAFASDPAFRDWILRRLRNPDLPREDADTIRDLAKGSCPKGREALCAELSAAAEAGRPSAPAPASPSPDVRKGSPK